MSMSPQELDEAIIGAKYREARELSLPRLIAYMIAKYLDWIPKKTKIYDFHPLLFDKVKTKKSNIKGSEEWKRMEEIHARRDALRKKKKRNR